MGVTCVEQDDFWLELFQRLGNVVIPDGITSYVESLLCRVLQYDAAYIAKNLPNGLQCFVRTMLPIGLEEFDPVENSPLNEVHIGKALGNHQSLVSGTLGVNRHPLRD
ncbi:hypothetical protein D3C85_1068560 [compost metagenome]